jgi:magnesium chelatase family protein
LASRGVLYLDEIAQFPRAALEVLRQPLEAGTVTIARAAGTCTFPARFSLVASMIPCPCGRRGERNADCRCDDAAVERYRSRMSGPLLERIDLHVNVVRVPYNELSGNHHAETSTVIRHRVITARGNVITPCTHTFGGATCECTPLSTKHPRRCSKASCNANS